MSGGALNDLGDILMAESLETGRDPLFSSRDDLYNTIDSTEKGDIAWECFEVSYNDALPETPEPWMTKKHQIWFRDPREVLRSQLGNPDFKGEMDYAPKRVYSADDDERQYCDFMSGNWAWKKAVCFALFTMLSEILTNIIGHLSRRSGNGWSNIMLYYSW